MGASWTDLRVDGKRLDRIIKMCETLANDHKDTPSLQMAYMDRLIKAENTKINLAELVLRVDLTLKEIQKIVPKPIIRATS